MTTLTVNQMERINGGECGDSKGEISTRHKACVIAMGIATGIWTTAAGMASLGAGFALGIAGAAFSDWVCSKVE